MISKAISVRLLAPLITRISGNSRDRQLLYHRSFVLLLTFVLYMTYRISRRPLSIAKAVFHNDKCILDQVNNETSHWKHENVQLNLTHLNSTDRNCGWEPFDGADGKQLLGRFLVIPGFSVIKY